jgi:3-deoxy-D-manno-octulosonic-acid transferase
MFIVYNFILFLILLISPFIILVRLFLGKEDQIRFKEKYGFFKKNIKKNELIWIHCASVGELLSVIPIIRRFEKDKKTKSILITSSTTSSSEIISKFKFKKTIHQFYPFDINFLTKYFIRHWKPKLAIFIDSEIWPNMFNNLHKKNIPLILLNARITKKSFYRWKKFPNFSKRIFNKITIALPQNKETKKYLKLLGTKNIKHFGNLKFYGETQKYNRNNLKLKKKFAKRLVFCAASTHQKEELFIAKVHKELKSEIKNLITIIIPRHINRKNEIINELENLGLNSQLHTSSKKINKDTDIYLVDTYGETAKFYSLSKITFLGGSLIPHGGQNPLEPAREGNYILYGPHIENFKEVYEILNNLKITSKVNSIKNMKSIVSQKINFLQRNTVNKKLKYLGEKILNKNFNEIKKFI